MSNPQAVTHMTFYPERNPRTVADACHSQRWSNCDRSLQTATVRVGEVVYFLDELAMLDDGSYVIPQVWYTWSGVLCGDFIVLNQTVCESIFLY
jgi:hypothetical protein